MSTAPAIIIEALGRDDLVALVRMAIARKALTCDHADLARARQIVLDERAADAKRDWEEADHAYREAMREADAIQDQQHRREEFVQAANAARSAGDLVRTLHRIWRRADDKAALGRRELDEMFRNTISDQKGFAACR